MLLSVGKSKTRTIPWGCESSGGAHLGFTLAILFAVEKSWLALGRDRNVTCLNYSPGLSIFWHHMSFDAVFDELYSHGLHHLP